MTGLAEWTQRNCTALGLICRITENIKISEDKIIYDLCIIENVGGKRGMIIVENYKKIDGHQRKLVELGYGYTVIAGEFKPRDDEKESFIELIVDWGWTGPVDEKPEWL